MKLPYQGRSNISSYTYPSGNFQTFGSNWKWLWPLKSSLFQTILRLLDHQMVLRVGFKKVGQIRLSTLMFIAIVLTIYSSFKRVNLGKDIRFWSICFVYYLLKPGVNYSKYYYFEFLMLYVKQGNETKSICKGFRFLMVFSVARN